MIQANVSVDLNFRGAQCFYLDEGVVVAPGIGNPEGLVTANRGSLLSTDTGLYRKTTQGGNTGWELIGSMPPSSTTPFTFFKSGANVSTVGTGNDQLNQVPIPANVFAVNGDGVRIVGQGLTSGAAGTKSFQVDVGASTVFLSGAINPADASDILWVLEIKRHGADELLCTTHFIVANNGVISTQQLNTIPATGFNFTTAINVTFFGNCANGADVITQQTTEGSKV